MSQSKPSGLSAAFGHQLKPNGVSKGMHSAYKNTSQYLRIEALRIHIGVREILGYTELSIKALKFLFHLSVDLME